MSDLPIGLSIAQVAGMELVNLVFFRLRSIGGFIPNVTVSENHDDELVITEHPVEQSASITDHAYKRPSTVTIKVGYSNSAIQSLLNPFYVQQIYEQFLQLQASRTPFDVVTGKRTYRNMLAGRIHVNTDEKNETALDMSVECREIILTSTQTVTIPAANQATPSVTNPVTPLGQQSLTPGTGINSQALPS